MIKEVISADDFKFAFRGHPAGVGIVTADAGEGPVAMTVSSLFSVGLEPPTLVFSASALSSATPMLLSAETLVVHLVGVEQMELAKLCATSGVDRFGGSIEWDRLSTGEPYYPGVAAWLRGRVAQTISAGGSTLVVVEVLEGNPRGVDDELVEFNPLVYLNGGWHALGAHTRL